MIGSCRAFRCDASRAAALVAHRLYLPTDVGHAPERPAKLESAQWADSRSG